jgi:hypothetical protein
MRTKIFLQMRLDRRNHLDPLQQLRFYETSVRSAKSSTTGHRSVCQTDLSMAANHLEMEPVILEFADEPP